MQHVIVVGGGFSGLGTAYELLKRGVPVSIYEATDSLGGLAGSFPVGGTRLEKFYHHWFNNDTTALQLVHELGLEDNLIRKNSNTGTYYANSIHRLSGPKDLLKFKPLPLIDRVRLGKLALMARRVNDWHALEKITAEEWLIQMAGRNVYDVMWKPLLVGKFGDYSNQVAAVWIWNKLRLRGGSRGKGQKEELYYLRGGFQRLTNALAEKIVEMGGEIHLQSPVAKVRTAMDQVRGIELTDGKRVDSDTLVITLAPELAHALLQDPPTKLAMSLKSIPYLAAQCVILEMDRSLSSTYWLNVNDMEAPFVGVIEHTNFEESSEYEGRHIAYLGKYLPRTARHYTMGEGPVVNEYLEYLPRMFPEFDQSWVQDWHVWRADYAQPVVLPFYRDLVPPMRTEINGLWLCNMAQVYPEDRGTNYALQYGYRCAREMVEVARKTVSHDVPNVKG